MSLMKRFYQDPYLHLRSFSLSLASGIALCAAAWHFTPHDWSQFSYAPWMWLLVPLGIYWGGLSAVFIHNATHGAFKPSWMNWVAGNLAGLHQLWGFTGWKLIHLVHHHYSDNVEHDTHPPKGYTFWQFARIMFVYSSKKISQRYREHFGTSPSTLRRQKIGVVVLVAMMSANLLFWVLLLGPAGFVFFYVPSYIANHLLFVDINYTAHPADEQGNTAAANLNHNLYYKLANFFWFGIYFHGNHHRKPLLFNPRYMPQRAPKQEKEEQVAA
jgi:stearoyl-CoA desaturase (delta-9 desaturase)